MTSKLSKIVRKSLISGLKSSLHCTIKNFGGNYFKHDEIDMGVF